jgi:hypothetical protein
MSLQQIADSFRAEIRRTQIEAMILSKRLVLLNGAKTLGSQRSEKHDRSAQQNEDCDAEMSISTLSDDEEYNLLQELKEEVDDCLSGSRILQLTSVVQKLRLQMERMSVGGIIDEEYPSEEEKTHQEALRIQGLSRKFVAVGLLKDILQFASYDPKVYQRLRSESLSILAIVSNGDQSICRAFQEGGFFARVRVILTETILSAMDLEAILSTLLNLLAEQPSLVVELVASKCLSILEEHFRGVFGRLNHLRDLSGEELLRGYYEQKELLNSKNVFCMIWLLTNCLRGCDKLPRIAESSDMISKVYEMMMLYGAVKQMDKLFDSREDDKVEEMEASKHWVWSMYHYLGAECKHMHHLSQKVRHLRTLLNLSRLEQFLSCSLGTTPADARTSNHHASEALRLPAAPALSLIALLLEHGLSEEHRDMSLVDELLGLSNSNISLVREDRSTVVEVRPLH